MHFPLSFCKNASPYFSMVHLLHRLYGVDAAANTHDVQLDGVLPSFALSVAHAVHSTCSAPSRSTDDDNHTDLHVRTRHIACTEARTLVRLLYTQNESQLNEQQQWRAASCFHKIHTETERHALVLQCNPYSRTSGYNTLQWRTAWHGTQIDWANNNDRRLTTKSLNDVASILQTNRRAVNSVFEHHQSCQTNDAIMLARCSLLHIRARTLETHHQTISSL